MKKILITVALVAATAGANAQDVSKSLFPDKSFTIEMLDEAYTAGELEDILTYTVRLAEQKELDMGLVKFYKKMIDQNQYKNYNLLLETVYSLQYYFPDEVKQAQRMVEAENGWDD